MIDIKEFCLKILRIWKNFLFKGMHLIVFIVGVLFQFPLIVHTMICQPFSIYDKYPPRVQHSVLNPTFLENYTELFVIGDVHGCYDELQLLLKKANATSDDVLKIFVGDLLRKGPKNLEVLHYIRNCESCISVRGNNDQKCLLKVYFSHASNNYKLKRSDKWMKKLSPADLEYLEELPYSISIPSLDSVIVHGGLLPGVPLEKQRPWTMMNLRDITPDSDCPGGFRANPKQFKGHPWASKWRGPQHVYFGHDNKRKLQLYPFATGIDTSCYRGNYLTGLFISGNRSGTFVTQNALDKYQ
ncbi:metallophos domain-containing protein [Caerostris extrusa]|uniref:Metallophos domain-containing protein n=1 Tax=Caerostris extrusa TaxID=172846 RepID=A0AAV4MRY3_CAEEX|nr:metallophos domain-containing protein [Caerostris extrusa]